MTQSEIKELKDNNREPPLQEMKKQFYLHDEKAITETDQGLQMTFVISTETVDRDQDVIKVDGWDLSNYQKNPVILWAHDYTRPPVAKSLSVWVEDGKLKSTALFMQKETSAFGYSIGKMMQEGFLNAVSVGFRGLEARWSPDEENRPWGIDYFKQELLEYSVVPVPANPEALVEAKSKGIDVSHIFDWVAECLEAGADAIPKEQAEKIYSLLKTKTFFTPPEAPAVENRNGLFLYQKAIQINENRRKLLC